MNEQSVKCDCGAIVSAEGKATLDSVSCNSCGSSIRVTPRRLAEGRTHSSPASRPDEPHEDEHFDVFISHASEDKDDLARPLAAALERRGLRVWYDESKLSVGDSIRRNIDRALTRSRFGVVVLSPHFFSKEWPNRELDGLIARSNGRVVVLPILHGITQEELREYSPTLADRVSVSSAIGVEKIADRIYEATQYGNSRPIVGVADAAAGATIDSIRRAILVASNHHELKKYLYEIEKYLSRHGDNVDARLLKDVIEQALHYECSQFPIHRQALRIGMHIAIFLLLMVGSIGLYQSFKSAPIPITVAASREGDELTVASAPSTKLRFVLRWEGENDLDLSVIAPSGDQISYSTPVTETGRLEEDVRVGPGKETIHIDMRSPGIYRVIVSDFSARGTPEFELAVVLDGDVRKRYVGTLEEGRRTYTLNVDLER